MAGRLGGTLAALFFALPSGTGPYDMALAPGPKAPSARGSARLVFADSPFGVAATADGHLRYEIRITAQGLPAPATLGDYHAFVAWEVTPDLKTWTRLGTVTNGVSTVGVAQLNKFLLVVTAEPKAHTGEHSGPTVLHGSSPSTWLQRFLNHPMFRGAPG